MVGIKENGVLEEMTGLTASRDTSKKPMAVDSEMDESVPIPSGGRELVVKGCPMSGTAGMKVLLNTNFFEIQSLPIQKTFSYDVRLRVPESSQRRGSDKVTPMQQAKVLLHGAVKKFWGNDFVFDGVSTAWSPRELVQIGESVSTTIELEGHTTERPNQVDIMLRNNGLLDIKSLVDYVQSGKVELDYLTNPTIEPLIRWLNSIYRKDPTTRFISRPRSNAFFERSPSTCLELQSTAGLLEAIRGLFQTVQIRFGRLGLIVDTSTAAFYTPEKNIIHLLHGLTGVAPRDDVQRWFSTNQAQFYQSCQRLEGIFINVRHLSPSQNARKIKIVRLNSSSAQDTTFNEKTVTGEAPTTVSAYYERKYSLRLRYPELPLAVTNLGLFPLELCYTSTGERYKEQLQGVETADFIRFATAPAFVRSQQIMANVEKLHWHDLDTPKAYGLSVKPNMLRIAARVLPAPTPIYSTASDTRPPILGSWNLRNKQFLNPTVIKSYGLLYLPGSRAVSDSQLQVFVRSLCNGFRAVGMAMPNSLPAFLKGNPQGDLKQIIAELLGKAASAFRQKKVDLLIFLIHSSQERLYRVIKNICDVRLGVSSQVMQIEKAFGRGQDQYIANIALKVNAKRGGINSRIAEPLLQQSRWMMLGGDVTHPSPGQRRLNPPPPSFTALSGSYDQDACLFSSITSAQGANEEIIVDLGAMARELLERFRVKQDGRLPESIFYWRDGVSDSQFQQILAVEVAALKEACLSFGDHAPKITVVCCIKRHHVRLFPVERGDRNGNCPPGTIVENSSGQDFYIISQAVLQGTARPTRYLTLLDENDLSVDDFQRVTNNLCWSYARATRAVGLVSPAYYAHQIAERARLHLSEGRDGNLYLPQVHEDLKFKMYWQ